MECFQTFYSYEKFPSLNTRVADLPSWLKLWKRSPRSSIDNLNLTIDTHASAVNFSLYHHSCPWKVRKSCSYVWKANFKSKNQIWSMVPMRRVSIWFGLLSVLRRRPCAKSFCGQSTQDINGIRIKLSVSEWQICKILPISKYLPFFCQSLNICLFLCCLKTTSVCV